MSSQSRNRSLFVASILMMLVAACGPSTAVRPSTTTTDMRVAQGSQEQILLGRQLVISHACSECHGGNDNPAAAGWLQGVRSPDMEFKIGPCLVTPGAQPCFTTRPKNITPDDATGIGRFSERQIFNALRYGLRPEETPDVEITSNIPGQGNFPANPHYLAPPMPWTSWRHMSDTELWAIAAYLKRGVKPATNKVADSDRPPDFWTGTFRLDTLGTHVDRPYPTANEIEVAADSRDQVLLGRHMVISHGCGGCHSRSEDNPAAQGWLQGDRGPDMEFKIGPCAVTPGAQPCFTTRPKNITPDNTTGIGRFSERQIFNALRYGLRPEETADVEITSSTPGQGNFPANPHYLAPPMPWTSWRHMSDAELRAIAAYLKRGLKPVANKVADSEGPPDFWADAWKAFGTYPAPPYPTANER